MGNCGLMRGAVAGGERSSEVVRVVTSSGGVMELAAPVTADAAATSFPGRTVFRCPDDLLLNGPAATPYRVSCEEAEPDAVPRFQNRRGRGGVWKVKLVISQEQLAEILSQERPDRPQVLFGGRFGSVECLQ